MKYVAGIFFCVRVYVAPNSSSSSFLLASHKEELSSQLGWTNDRKCFFRCILRCRSLQSFPILFFFDLLRQYIAITPPPSPRPPKTYPPKIASYQSMGRDSFDMKFLSTFKRNMQLYMSKPKLGIISFPGVSSWQTRLWGLSILFLFQFLQFWAIFISRPLFSFLGYGCTLFMGGPNCAVRPKKSFPFFVPLSFLPLPKVSSTPIILLNLSFANFKECNPRFPFCFKIFFEKGPILLLPRCPVQNTPPLGSVHFWVPSRSPPPLLRLSYWTFPEKGQGKLPTKKTGIDFSLLFGALHKPSVEAVGHKGPYYRRIAQAP